MAGHSHWAGIKHKKGANDAARGKIFQKLFKEIYVAATSGSVDPDSNPSLKLAIAKARSKNMPKVNIEKALTKARGDGKNGAVFTEMIFNATISGGGCFLVITLTDNTTRTISNLKAYFNKQNANLGKTGQIPYQFEHKGIIEVSKTLVSEDDISMVAIENGALDLEVLDESYLITTTPDTFSKCKSAIERDLQIFEFLQCEVSYVPNDYIAYNKEKYEKLMSFVELLEDDDDIQEVIHNLEEQE